MTLSPENYPANQVEEWLHAHGFERDNPFKTTNADEERAYLAESLFVTVPEYDRIRGDQTVLVFAPRGSGKSTLRVRLAAISLPQDASSKTLAVECTDFSWLVNRHRTFGQVTEEDYEIFLLKQAAKSLLELFLPLPLTHPPIDAEQDFHRREQMAKDVAANIRPQISAFLRRSLPSLLSPPELFKYMVRLSSNFNGKWLDFQGAAEEKKLKNYLARTNLNPKLEVARLLADLCDDEISNDDQYRSVIDAFEELVQIAQAVGIEQVHFLIDRLDEMQLFANDYEAQANILEPLLAYLNLMELPGIAFKFFVARELYQVLRERPSIRRDRLLNKAVQIQWDPELLKQVLNERLLFFSHDEISSLAPLCSQDGTPIEEEMLKLATGSPRRLLTAGQLLVQVHVSSDRADELLNLEDWQKAREQLMTLMPPIMVLHLENGEVAIGSKQIKLTKTEIKILETLSDNDGYCDRETFASEIWGTKEGVTNEAVDQAVNRLRHKLDDDGQQPVYLQTIRGKNRGFRLQNYELSS